MSIKLAMFMNKVDSMKLIIMQNVNVKSFIYDGHLMYSLHQNEKDVNSIKVIVTFQWNANYPNALIVTYSNKLMENTWWNFTAEL